MRDAAYKNKGCREKKVTRHESAEPYDKQWLLVGIVPGRASGGMMRLFPSALEPISLATLYFLQATEWAAIARTAFSHHADVESDGVFVIGGDASRYLV
jgi:hypothetical protein